MRPYYKQLILSQVLIITVITMITLLTIPTITTATLPHNTRQVMPSFVCPLDLGVTHPCRGMWNRTQALAVRRAPRRCVPARHISRALAAGTHHISRLQWVESDSTSSWRMDMKRKRPISHK